MKYDFTSIIDRHGMDAIAVDSWALNINFIRTPPIFIRTCADEYGNPIP